MNEHRNYHRLNVEIPMTFRVPPDQNEFTTTTINIGGMGIYFTTTRPLQERQELLLYLHLPGQDDKVELHAQVVRVDPQEGDPEHRVAVKLTDNIKFDEKEFVKFYAQQLNRFFKGGTT